jgi:hypothetical protein
MPDRGSRVQGLPNKIYLLGHRLVDEVLALGSMDTLGGAAESKICFG